jgi:hypothetical protein
MLGCCSNAAPIPRRPALRSLDDPGALQPRVGAVALTFAETNWGTQPKARREAGLNASNKGVTIPQPKQKRSGRSV